MPMESAQRVDSLNFNVQCIEYVDMYMHWKLHAQEWKMSVPTKNIIKPSQNGFPNHVIIILFYSIHK